MRFSYIARCSIFHRPIAIKPHGGGASRSLDGLLLHTIVNVKMMSVILVNSLVEMIYWCPIKTLFRLLYIEAFGIQTCFGSCTS